MNTYKINIFGIHCSGCKNLIKMSMEDENLQNVVIDDNAGIAQFSSEAGVEEVKKIIDRVFAELKEYSYSGLEGVNN